MVEYETSENLKGVTLNVSKRKTKKKQIFLYDTNRRLDDYIMKLIYRRNKKYDDIPHYIISKTGQIIKVFDTKYSSITFYDPSIDKFMVKIAMENLGWLNKNTITGVLHNWIGDPYRLKPFEKKWRDYYYWDPYTEEQINAVILLCKDICKEHNIPYLTVPSQGYLSNIRKFNGIVCKSNFLNIYTDINPSFDFNLFYKDDRKQQ